MIHVEVRPGTASDLDRVLALNRAAVPAVNDIEPDALAALARDAVRFDVAVVGDEIVGFVIVLEPGLAYESVNYRWFSQRYDGFWYVDRIAVAEAHRAAGVGRALYEHVIALALPVSERVCAEVNLRPRNDISLAFHDRFGFTEVGRQATEGGTKEVSLLTLGLAPPRDELADLEADVASVARLLDGLDDLEPGERSAVLARLEAGAGAGTGAGESQA